LSYRTRPRQQSVEPYQMDRALDVNDAAAIREFWGRGRFRVPHQSDVQPSTKTAMVAVTLRCRPEGSLSTSREPARGGRHA
jgi:hypothetical protein